MSGSCGGQAAHSGVAATAGSCRHLEGGSHRSCGVRTSLLRRRRAHQEFTLRADTNRALGFHEAKAVFQSKPKCVVIQIHHDQTHAMLDKFHALKEYSLEITTPAALFLTDQKRPSNLCYILLDIAQNSLIAHNLLLSMRTHDLTPHASQR